MRCAACGPVDAELPPGGDALLRAAAKGGAVDCIQLLHGEFGDGIGLVDEDDEGPGLAFGVERAGGGGDAKGLVFEHLLEAENFGGPDLAAQQAEVGDIGVERAERLRGAFEGVVELDLGVGLVEALFPKAFEFGHEVVAPDANVPGIGGPGTNSGACAG